MTQSPSDTPLTQADTAGVATPVPREDQPRTETGVPIIHGGGLQSAAFSFSYVDGLLLRASVHDEQVRQQWKAAGEQAAARVLQEAAAARDRARAEHEKEVGDRRQQLEHAREELAKAGGHLAALEGEVAKLSSRGRAATDVRKRLREVQAEVADLEAFAVEV